MATFNQGFAILLRLSFYYTVMKAFNMLRSVFYTFGYIILLHIFSNLSESLDLLPGNC